MVNLKHENSLLQKIGQLDANSKIEASLMLTAGGAGSGLTAAAVKPEIEKLIPTTRQRINAAKFYLDAIKNMNYGALSRRSTLFTGRTKTAN